ncbi:MAG TPA: hypothetical protein DCZ75_09340 [Geobacter sp.]|nr:hypothetical protein [Geobacter sp.]
MIFALLCVGCSESDTGKSARNDATPATPAAVSVTKGASDGTAIELTPSPEGFPLGLSVSQGFALNLFETPSPSQGFKKFPAETGSKRYFDEFTIAGNKHLVITEESSPPRFYFDENHNGDLTDDRPPSEGEKAASLLPNFYSILIRYDEEKVVAPYRLWVFGSNMGGVRFYPACHWVGILTVNGTGYQVVAFDGNCDGDYSNDPVVIDVNHNGKAEDDEKLTAGASITIEGQQVKLLSMSRSGLTVRFKL